MRAKTEVDDPGTRRLGHALEFKGNKSYLPNKPCAACGRLMTWRKSWSKNWESVKYCSEPCRQARSKSGDRNHP
jgi:hypothetical protein